MVPSQSNFFTTRNLTMKELTSGLFFILIYITNEYTTAETSTGINSNNLSYFELATKSSYFVDKTNLLKDFLNHEQKSETYFFSWGSSLAIAFLCPHGFGKTTNLDMVRRFFELTIDKTTGQKIDKNTTHYYNLFTNKSLNLNIAQEPNFIEEHFGEYPMIYLDFSNIKGNTTDEIITSMRKRIGRVLKSYRWLCTKTRKENKKTKDQRLKQHLSYFKKIFKNTANADDFVYALESVAELLTQHFNKSRIMVLIDSHDTPITHAIVNKIDAKPIYDYMNLLMKKFVHYEHSSCHLMIVGASESFLDGWNSTRDRSWINTIIVNPFLRCTLQFGQYFGFTNKEVAQLFTKRDVDRNKQEKIREYFNNYKFLAPEDSCVKDISLYYPKGVLQYLETNTIEDNYLDTGTFVPNIMKCLRHQEYFRIIWHRLTKKQELSYFTNGNRLTYKSYIQELIYLVENECSSSSYVLFEKVLFNSGYLSFAVFGIEIPNKMVEKQLKRDMNEFIFDIYGVNTKDTDSHLNATIQSILNSVDITNEMLTNLANSLQHMLNSTKIRLVNEFQFQSIVFGALLNHWEYDQGISMEYLSTGRQVEQAIDRLIFQNHHQKMALIVRVFYNETLQEAIGHVRNCIPAKWPRPSNNKHFGIVKYLAITLNKTNQVEVGKGQNRIG